VDNSEYYAELKAVLVDEEKQIVALMEAGFPEYIIAYAQYNRLKDAALFAAFEKYNVGRYIPAYDANYGFAIDEYNNWLRANPPQNYAYVAPIVIYPSAAPEWGTYEIFNGRDWMIMVNGEWTVTGEPEKFYNTQDGFWYAWDSNHNRVITTPPAAE
jgi:hypothetical protein